MSMIRNLALAEAGKQKIDWVQHHMPLLNGLKERYE